MESTIEKIEAVLFGCMIIGGVVVVGLLAAAVIKHYEMNFVVSMVMMLGVIFTGLVAIISTYKVLVVYPCIGKQENFLETKQ